MNHDLIYMYKVSQEFFEAGLRTSEYLFQNIEEIKGNFYQIPVAAINLAFCAELALKTISLTQNIPFKHIHKLFELFQHLPIECRKEVVENFEKIETFDRKQFPIVRLRKTGVADNIKLTEIGENTATMEKVKRVFKVHDDAFILWRYSFEMAYNPRPSIHFDFSSMLRLNMSMLQYLSSKLN